MASVSSPYRKILKPLILKFLGPNLYQWFQYQAKLKDIEQRLVEEAEMALLPQILQPDDYCLDIGANFAYYSVRLADLCPQGKIFAFEPIPSTHKICQKILQHYGKKNVHLHRKGVGSRSETLEFQIPMQEIGTPSAGQAHFLGRNNDLQGREMYHPFQKHETVRCEVVAIDDFFPDLPRLDFIKIDIEGAEYFALQGMKASLQKHKPVILIEICPFFLKGFGIDENMLRTLVNELGYDFYAFNQNTNRIQLHIDASFKDGNYFLLPKDNNHRMKDIISHAN